MKNYLKSFIGFTWAIAVIFVVSAGFINMDYFSQKLLYDNGIHVSENWSGGDVDTIVKHGEYSTTIHKPVFKGIHLMKSKGFIQIKWDSNSELPDIIKEQFDYNKDGSNDFEIELDTHTNQAVLKPFNKNVLSLSREQVLIYEKSRVIRVNVIMK